MVSELERISPNDAIYLCIRYPTITIGGEIDEDIKCRLCHRVAFLQHYSNTCGHLICEYCKRLTLEKFKNRCGICGRRIHQIETGINLEVTKKVNDLLIGCPNFFEGCNFKYKVMDMVRHINVCNYEMEYRKMKMKPKFRLQYLAQLPSRECSINWQVEDVREKIKTLNKLSPALRVLASPTYATYDQVIIFRVFYDIYKGSLYMVINSLHFPYRMRPPRVMYEVIMHPEYGRDTIDKKVIPAVFTRWSDLHYQEELRVGRPVFACPLNVEDLMSTSSLNDGMSVTCFLQWGEEDPETTNGQLEFVVDKLPHRVTDQEKGFNEAVYSSYMLTHDSGYLVRAEMTLLKEKILTLKILSGPNDEILPKDERFLVLIISYEKTGFDGNKRIEHFRATITEKPSCSFELKHLRGHPVSLSSIKVMIHVIVLKDDFKSIKDLETLVNF